MPSWLRQGQLHLLPRLATLFLEDAFNIGLPSKAGSSKRLFLTCYNTKNLHAYFIPKPASCPVAVNPRRKYKYTMMYQSNNNKTIIIIIMFLEG